MIEHFFSTGFGTDHVCLYSCKATKNTRNIKLLQTFTVEEAKALRVQLLACIDKVEGAQK